jgi:hypothetical protein
LGLDLLDCDLVHHCLFSIVLNQVCHAPLAASGLRYARLLAMQADFSNISQTN